MNVEFQPYDDAMDWTELNPKLSLPDEGDVYVYPHHEIYEGETGEILQTRSGPNWQGGALTLTTCKQFMRSWRAPSDWVGVWFCGLIPGVRKVLYIAQVRDAFDSNYALGAYVDQLDLGFEEKSAENCPCGDLYRPKSLLPGAQRWQVESLHPPMPHHTRMRENYPDGTPKWWKDIRYRGSGGRYPATFLFSNVHLWSRWHEAPDGSSINTGRSGCRLTLQELRKEIQ